MKNVKHTAALCTLSLFVLCLCLCSQLFAANKLHPRFAKLTPTQLNNIGNKIWRNECGKSIEKLTWWIDGEECASLGIGHFIWYPESAKGNFSQTFPSLLNFFAQHGTKLPTWLAKQPAHAHCPWKTHKEFFDNFKSAKMQELRTLLSSTIDLQIKFIMQRSSIILEPLLNAAPANKKKNIKKQYERMLNSPNGIYALIDYHNFKGDGINKKERYNGKGWGLLQVLEAMENANNYTDAVQEFAQVAKKTLTSRVANAPKKNNEQRFLLGWMKRIDTYTAPL